jgi:hypothetical protein
MPRLTYANVVATLALFVALGGTSYAALKVTSRDVRDGSLRGRDIRAGSLKSKQVKDGSLLARDFKAGQLPAGAAGAAGPVGPAGPAGAPGSDAANVVLAHVATTATVADGSTYSGIAGASGATTATTVTDVISLETGNRQHATVSPVPIRVSDLTVAGGFGPRALTVRLKQVNAVPSYLECTIPAGQSGCTSTGAADIPAGTRLIVTVSVPDGPGAMGPFQLAMAWRAAPTG